MDRNLGRLMACLEEQGIADNTIVVLTADHGEMLGIHGRWMKNIWYKESVGIPFIIRWPGRIPAGLRSDCFINTPDVMPTLLGLMGVDCPAGRDGADLSQQLLGRSKDQPDTAFFSFCTGAPPPHMTCYYFPIEKGRYWRGLRNARYTYACVDQRTESIFYAAERRDAFPPDATRVLIDNKIDPWQVKPIYPGDAAETDAIIDELHGQLVEWLEGLGDPFLNDYWSEHRVCV